MERPNNEEPNRPGEYIGRFEYLEELVMALGERERREVAMLLTYAAERGPGNFRTTYTPEEIDERQRDYLRIWVADKFRLKARSDNRFDAYRGE
jgi:hypothetical protein